VPHGSLNDRDRPDPRTRRVACLTRCSSPSIGTRRAWLRCSPRCGGSHRWCSPASATGFVRRSRRWPPGTVHPPGRRLRRDLRRRQRRLDPRPPARAAQHGRRHDIRRAVPVVKIGRIAASSPSRGRRHEVRGAVELPAYRGDAVNANDFTPESPSPTRRLLGVYNASAATSTSSGVRQGRFRRLRSMHSWKSTS